VTEGLVIANSVTHPEAMRHVNAPRAVRVNANGSLEDIAFVQHAFAKALEPLSPVRAITLANTGIGAATGGADQHWVIRSGDAASGPYPQPARICAAPSIYGANDPSRSQWISVEGGTTPGVPVRTKYAFETTFDLSGFDLRTVRIVAHVLADNGVEQVRLNGRPLPIAPWSDWYAGVTFFEFHSLEITEGFVPGKNVISFVVANGTDLPAASESIGEPPEVPNPMALRVEWHGSGRPL
jgi:hypothetical protein